MPAFQFGFGNPANYSDWATYAGLDGRRVNSPKKPPEPECRRLKVSPIL